MRIKFDGAEADNHKLEAYEGIKSLEGLIRVARIASHYAATGEVRFRAPYSDKLEAQISQINNGSFEMLFDYASRITDLVTSDRAKNKAEALFNFLVRKGTGQTDNEDLLLDDGRIPSGDIAAMNEASEAALKAAHRWINTNEKTISIIDGEEQTSIDKNTKNYVETEIMGDEETRDVSVAAMNVNSKNGRVFLFDEQRTVPFLVHKEARGRTVTNLSKFLSKYAERSGDTVNIRFRAIRHTDGRIKRLIIFDCYEARDAA